MTLGQSLVSADEKRDRNGSRKLGKINRKFVIYYVLIAAAHTRGRQQAAGASRRGRSLTRTHARPAINNDDEYKIVVCNS